MAMRLKSAAGRSMALVVSVLVAVHATSLAQTAPASAAPATGTSPNASSGGGPVYSCPGPTVLYTNSVSANEARERGCRTIEGAPITIVPATRPRTNGNAASAAKPGENRIDPAEQRARDSDARRILGDELRREEDRLAQLRREYNNGEPERNGDERNYQRYLDRVAEMKAAIARKEADVGAIRRELSKLPQ